MSRDAKVVLVTGCSKGGIGFAICEEFAMKGCKVYATARRLEAMESAQPGIERLALDITSDANVNDVVANVIKREGRIDIVINNAGVMCHGPLLDVPIEGVASAFDTNCLSVLRVCKAVVPHMASRKSGLIVNIGSVVGEIPGPWSGGYAASKAAMHSISQTLAMELRPLGIRVLNIAPGGVRSRIADNHIARVPLLPDSLWAGYRSTILKVVMTRGGGRSSTCEEVAQRVVGEALREGWAVGQYRLVWTAPPAGIFWLLTWFPRRLVLWLIWRAAERFGKAQ
ncbi:oxidoreductase [Fomitopsis betulina]|nr:oxidoreductase [Fomitopsis betulina]